MKVKISESEVYEIAIAEELSVKDFLDTVERLDKFKVWLQQNANVSTDVVVKNKGGRPKKHNIKAKAQLTSENIENVKKMLAEGYQVKSIKKATGVKIGLIRKIKKELKRANQSEQTNEVEVEEPKKYNKEYDRDTVLKIMRANVSGDKELFFKELQSAGMSYGVYYALRKQWIKKFNFTAEELGVQDSLKIS